ncbi:MAG: ribosome silencing factor [Anabaena sp. CRKS33]|jgi:ribosome-associated protein|nr:MAG: ribosome silencing factor [Anabaena sp. CRKS33]
MTESLRGNFPLTKKAVIEPKTDTETTSKNLALTIAEAGYERKAGEIILLNLANISYLSDYFVIMTGYSKVQVRAIADAVEGQVEIEWQRRPRTTEGKAEGTWILQDYGDVIVHIMMPREREFYNLEAFWGHAERIFMPNSDDIGG